METHNNCISLALSNCVSTNVIHDIINDYRLDFLALSETWFTSNTPATVMSDISPVGYAALHAPRSLSANREGPSRLSQSVDSLPRIGRRPSASARRRVSSVNLRAAASPSMLVAVARLRSVPHLQTTVDVYCASVRRRTH